MFDPLHDLDDTKALTPAHLLHGHCITSLPHEYTEENSCYGNIPNILQRAQLQAFLLNQFQAFWKYSGNTTE